MQFRTAKYRHCLILAILTAIGTLYAQPPAPATTPKSLAAHRTTTTPKIDGDLADPAWQDAAIASDFIQFEPVNGAPPYQPTEVRVLYDDKAVYVGAMLYDSAPDSILTQLSERDVGSSANADYLQIGFDTYDDDQNAFVFSVSAAGVQTDSRVSQIGEDVVWDAVWRSAVKINERGWVVEMEIPYSALRFPKNEVQQWGLQFRRIIRRRRESSTWNFWDRAVDGTVNQFGTLTGLRDIQPPLRLSVLPYVSGYVERYSPGKSGGSPSTGTSFNAGADLKVGLTESFTLDMTLVPDFGQVRFDNQVLNLSPFEIQFQENRQFFTEGTELFNIADVFYSRRVGNAPRNLRSIQDSLRQGESVLEQNGQNRLINAFKISGRSQGKTGVGVFNAMTSGSKAYVEGPDGNRDILTQPFTNYNVAVIDQAFKGNSYLSLINTNLLDVQGYMANVTASRFRLADAGNKWFVRGSGAVSQKWEDVGLGDASRGFAANYSMGKASGNFLFNIGQNIESHTYDPNDMGILFANNEFTEFGSVEYNVYKPVWKFRGIFNSFNASRTSLYFPRRYANLDLSYSSFFQLKSFDFFGISVWSSPFRNYDFFEARVQGRPFAKPPAQGFGAFLSSNYARRWAIDLNFDYGWANSWGWQMRNIRIGPRYRFNDKFQLIFNFRSNFSRNDRGFVNFDSLGTSLIGTRDRKDIENTLTAQYSFTNNISLNLRTRHYWSRVKYNRIEGLDENGILVPTYYDENHDINFNAFTVDCVFRWRFAPGSDLFVVWKNNILTSGPAVVNSFTDNLNTTFSSPQTNSLSVRILFYLDYLRFARK